MVPLSPSEFDFFKKLAKLKIWTPFGCLDILFINPLYRVATLTLRGKVVSIFLSNSQTQFFQISKRIRTLPSEKCANPDRDDPADRHHHSNPDGRNHTDQETAETDLADDREV